MVAIQGGHPPFKGDSPHLRPQPRRLSLHQHAPRSSPYDTGAGSHASRMLAQERRSQTAARAERVTAQRLQAFLRLRPNQRVKGGPPCRWHATAPRGRTLSTSTHPAWRPRPTRHVTGAPVTTCEKLQRHLRQRRAFSTMEPVPRLEATLRTAQQCQPGTPVTGQSATGEGATVNMAKSGPAVMAVAGGRKQQSNRLQAHVPSWNSERALSHGVKTTRPCSVP
jgi:hypothetical protein